MMTTDNHSIVDSKFQEWFQILTAIDQSQISHDQPNLLSSDTTISDPSPKIFSPVLGGNAISAPDGRRDFSNTAN